MGTFVRVTMLVALMVSPGCSSKRTAPSPLPLTGTWTGSVADSQAGNGLVTMILVQTDVGLSGTWTMTFGDPAGNKAGSVGGTVNGEAVSLFLTPNTPLACGGGFVLSGTLAGTATVAGTRMTGSYTVLVCNGATGGTIDLAKG